MPDDSKASESGEQSAEPFDSDQIRDQLTRVTVPPELYKRENRTKWKLEDEENENRGPYLIELNVQHLGGLPGAEEGFLKLYRKLFKAETAPSESDSIYEESGWAPTKITKGIYRCYLNVNEWRRLVAADDAEARKAWNANTAQDLSHYRCIYKLWPDFPIKGQICRSVATIKADAAYRSFEASGEEITWAVIDSGVYADHPHFGPPKPPELNALRHPSVAQLHRYFGKVVRTVGALKIPTRLKDPDKDPQDPKRQQVVEEHVRLALKDDFGHGTHVAGIITGHAPKEGRVVVLEREANIDPNTLEPTKQTKAKNISSERERDRFHGVARDCRIVSLRVLDENGDGRASDIIRALEYIRETLNDNPKMLRVHGVNLSVGYEFDAEMFACGQSPLCNEVNRLVQSGVVVVTAAGNTGYGTLNAVERPTKVGLSNTINDPGNAELAITVGATHRESPHTYGVSYFSSKGPTGDGRLKPDLVAPGERIISCAAGKKLEKAKQEIPPASTGANGASASTAANNDSSTAFYVEDTGTSMAAPHVSGAIAAFLSIRREFIGRPLDVKRIFLESAIPLGRERYFEGHGLLDLMKAIQSV